MDKITEKGVNGAEYEANWVDYDFGFQITGPGIEPFYLPNRQAVEPTLRALANAYDQGAEDYY